MGLCTGSFDATVRLWDCKSQSTKPIQIFEEAKDSISSVQVMGCEIVTGCVDGRMRLYDVRMGMVFVDVVGREYILCLDQSPLSYPSERKVRHTLYMWHDVAFTSP